MFIEHEWLMVIDNRHDLRPVSRGSLYRVHRAIDIAHAHDDQPFTRGSLRRVWG